MRVAVALQHIGEKRLVKAAVHPPAAHHTVKQLGADAGFCPHRQRLGIDRGIAHGNEIVQQFHLVAKAGRPQMHHLGGKAGDDRLDGLKNLGRGADHRAERSVRRIGRRATQRRVGKGNAQRLQLRRQRGGGHRVGSGAVDNDEAPAPARLQPRCATHNVFHLRRSSDTEKNNVAGLRHIRRGLCLMRAALDQIIHQPALFVRHDGERVALVEDAPRHAMAHETNADKADAGFGRHEARSWDNAQG